MFCCVQKQDSRFLTLTEYKNMVNKVRPKGWEGTHAHCPCTRHPDAARVRACVCSQMYLLGGVTFFCAAFFYIFSWIDASVIGGFVPLPWRLQLNASKWWAWAIFFWSG